MNMKKHKNKVDISECVICGQVYRGYGNNAHPVAEGRCCDYCNLTRVIPARMHAARQ